MLLIEEIKNGETKKIEFKEKLSENSINYTKTVVAFANGEGGKIIFGVANNKKIIGIENDKIFDIIDKITNTISDSCEPLIIPDITLHTVEKKTIIIVRIDSCNQKPYYIKSKGIKNGTFVRSGATTRPVDDYMLRELLLEGSNKYFDEEIYNYILSKINLGATFEGTHRVDSFEFPKRSIREAILNAIVHRSYINTSNIQVALYDDRLEITSPGGLLSGINIDKIKNGYSKIRNRSIAKVFSYLMLIEEWGSGIPRIFEEFEEYGLEKPTLLDEDGESFRIIFYRNKKSATQTTQSSSILTKEEEKLVKVILENPELSQREIANKINWTVDRVKYYLNKFKKNNIVIYKGSSHNGKWEIQEENIKYKIK